MDMLIREALREDFREWRQMVADYDSAVLNAADAWERFLSKSDPYMCLVAICDEQVAAFAHYTFHDFCFGRGPVCYLSDLYVSPRFRRRGIARALLTHIHDAGLREGWGRIYWVTEHDNPARALYDEIGTPQFVRYHVDLDPFVALSTVAGGN